MRRVLLLLALAACSVKDVEFTGLDDDGGDAGDAGDTGDDGDGTPFETPTPFALDLSPTTADQLQSVTAGPDGSFYAAGYRAAEIDQTLRVVFVAKLVPSGGTVALDPTFGTDGIELTPLVHAGGNDEIDIATQSTGKILVSATRTSAAANDRDLTMVRLNPDGAVDSTFGASGVLTVDVNTGISNGMNLVGLDASRGIAVGTDDSIYWHAAARTFEETMRTDTDFVVLKRTPDGAAAAFGLEGKFALDIDDAGATPRSLLVSADGSVLASGYQSSIALGSVQPVLYRVSPSGVLVSTFASGGVFHDTVLAMQAELYGVVAQGAHFIAAGYGRATGSTNDFLAVRFDEADGERDLAFGDAPNGVVQIDPSGTMLGSNCRGLVALPGGGVLLYGSTGPSAMPAQDAVTVFLDADGKLDTRYGTGIQRLALDPTGNDQWWGAAVSGSNVLVVGYKGGGMTMSESMNDDAYAVLFPLR